MGGRRAAALRIVTGALTVGALSASTPSRADDSPTRSQDQFFFGLYGGVAFASAASVTHWSDDNVRAELDGTTTSAAPVGGYAISWWPLEYFGLDGSFEVFGLPMGTDESRFDRCVAGDDSVCRLPRTPNYGGFGMQTGPTFRGAVPLRYLQLNGGVGLMLPVTFQFTQEPVSRLDGTAFEVGTAVRLVGGVNGYLSRDWRATFEYRLDYRFATLPTGGSDSDIAPLVQNDGLLTHMLVTGFSYSPESFKESADKATWIAVPLAIPAAGWVLAAVAKAIQKGPE